MTACCYILSVAHRCLSVANNYLQPVVLGPVPTTRVHGPCGRAANTSSVSSRATLFANTAHGHGCVREHRPSRRAVIDNDI